MCMRSIVTITLLSICVSLIPIQAMATAQYGDILIIDKDTSWINSNPLEAYFKEKGERTIAGEELDGLCTALWRGYVATWKIENDSLFLLRVQTHYCGDNPIDKDISKEFNSTRVFAYWVNSVIVKPEGELLSYIHMGYASVYEGESYYSFSDGKLTRQREVSYVKYDDSRVFPGEYFLYDTLKSLILSHVPLESRKDFDEENNCSIHIHFNDEGEIENISLGFGDEPETLMEKTMLAGAKKALENFPKLMLVRHERYHRPLVSIWLSGHCLKFPYDREYGCDDE